MPAPHLAPSRRRTWEGLPPAVRDAIESRLGARVVSWTSCDGGYSTGLASVVRTSAGEQVFLKAIDASDEFGRQLYRQEARRTALLPSGVPTPGLLWSATLDVVGDGPDGPWEVLAFRVAAGRTPRVPWEPTELGAVLDLADRIAEHDVAPGVLPEAGDELPLGMWEELAERTHPGIDTFDPWLAANAVRMALTAAQAPEAVRGSCLSHGDFRGDNTLVAPTADGCDAVVVDWPFAVRGAAFLDLVGALPAIRVEGGPEPEAVLAAHPLPAGTDPDAVTAYLAALTGYFVASSLRPAPAGAPQVRAFQRAQGEVCGAWLRRRLGE